MDTFVSSARGDDLAAANPGVKCRVPSLSILNGLHLCGGLQWVVFLCLLLKPTLKRTPSKKTSKCQSKRRICELVFSK